MVLLAGDTAPSVLGDAGITILIGLVVVFTVLLLLTGIFKLFGLIMSGFSAGEQTDIAPAAAVPAAAPVAPAVIDGNTQPVSGDMTVQNGIPDETVAVISAAVAAVSPAGQQYAVRGIRRKD